MLRLDSETAMEEVDTIVALAQEGNMLQAAEYLDRLCHEHFDAGWVAFEQALDPEVPVPPRPRYRGLS